MNSIAKPIQWMNGFIRIIDQSQLPNEMRYLDLHSLDDCIEAINHLQVRGAPAIGITAAYAVVLAVKNSQFGFQNIIDALAATRPTAVNLFWALNKMKERYKQHTSQSKDELISELLDTALRIHSEDALMCERIGEFGQELIEDNSRIITHCNTGVLATGGIGTALAIVYAAEKSGKKVHVYVDETRPLLQGARLTAWELAYAGISHTLICDNMASWVMKHQNISAVIVGADRITANGDTANKIGTYSLAVSAHYHRIPFYIAAPSSSFDLTMNDGSSIIIEERNSNEIRKIKDQWITTHDMNVFNPAFDVTPNELITGIITEKGILRQPYTSSIKNNL